MRKKIGLGNVECEFCAENEFSVQAKRKTCHRRKCFFFSFPLLSRVGDLARRTFCACEPLTSSVNAPNRQLFGNFCHLEQLLIFKAI